VLAGLAFSGRAWGAATSPMFWSLLLPVARDGAPLRKTIAAGAAPLRTGSGCYALRVAARALRRGRRTRLALPSRGAHNHEERSSR